MAAAIPTALRPRRRAVDRRHAARRHPGRPDGHRHRRHGRPLAGGPDGRPGRPRLTARTSWTIPDTTVRSWVTFGAWPDGSYGPIVDRRRSRRPSRRWPRRSTRRPCRRRSTRQERRRSSGSRPATSGRKLDVAGTSQARPGRCSSRGPAPARTRGAAIVPALAVVQPALTTEQAAEGRAADAAISSWTTYYQPGAAQRLRREHHDPVDGDQRDGRRPGRVVQLLEDGRRGQPGQGLQARRRDHRRPLGRGQVDRRRDLLVVDDDLQRGPPGRSPDGRPQEPLLLHQPLPEGSRRDRLQGRRRRRPGHDLPERHEVPDPDPRPTPGPGSSGSRSTACRPAAGSS